ncbi:hypothetical protein KZ829_17860 [Actinoplanes hulinensis]|uniref:FPG-type domain-containing protein n=1 Tax=Actinoplanes hulinensis TaxID=1144547 RepID=A0ABS7B5A1_9ACTN|nr:hypothetical protein [Actinoplanes hulinensis]MBW6435609.1 hypothetical protein [Actinoplanes hulinensis]
MEIIARLIEEREFIHLRAATRHRELRCLVPARPASTRTCPACKGTTRMMLANGHWVYCPMCNTRGWVPAA